MHTPQSFHIMVTDSNHHIRDYLKRELEKEGYTVCNVKTDSMAYEYIFNSEPLNLIILDPEIFHDVDQNFINEIVHRYSSLQIIIHTYTDSISNIQPSNNIHLVTKNGQSIGVLKSITNTCFDIFQEQRNS